ncbi:PREDICTED: uncharacterized protein LOC101821708 [Ficedula albicollis]|uniref:uncharacterized protein LOC101821708 n=1 Tax=Ficedula albicollis TaxID=59894 RepID=UPI000359D7E0|nr:PREDICTED: uncharacterized protein LOC101821708 [Ficedula albicollis]
MTELVGRRQLLFVWGKAGGGVPRGGWSGIDTAGEAVGETPGSPGGNEATLLAACPSPARRGCSRHPSLPACLPPIRACRLPLSPSSPGARSLLPGTAWPGKEPDSSRLGAGRCSREQSHPVALHPWQKGNAAPDSPHTRLARGPWQSRSAAPAMPHFLDWFVPVYLMISILILVGFGACIYYFEPGLQEAHKWRTQRPIMERDLRKTLMIRDNLAFGVPEV